jgi:Asp-tRNA(Asn)/Glu-tRNA(Gln) amidotransferase A subunit family amidase
MLPLINATLCLPLINATLCYLLLLPNNTALLSLTLAPELVAAITPERFHASRALIEPAVYERASPGAAVTAAEYLSAVSKLSQWRDEALELMDCSLLDAIVLPSVPMVPPMVPAVDASSEPGGGGSAAGHTPSRLGPAGMGVNTKVANMLGLCGVTLPCVPAEVAMPGDLPDEPAARRMNSGLPVGLDVLCRPKAELAALALAMAFENALPRPPAVVSRITIAK